MIGNPLFARFPERFQWTFHNVVAHPLSEILVSADGNFVYAGNRLHDWSIPQHDPGTGRG